MAIDFRLTHSLNACSPIEVTLLGMVTEVRLEQNSNASFPILVTLLGITIVSRLSQLANAPYSISVTDSGIVIDVSCWHPLKVYLYIFFIPEGILIFLTNLQLQNANSPIDTTSSGIETDRTLLLRNALGPTAVTVYEVAYGALPTEILLGITISLLS